MNILCAWLIACLRRRVALSRRIPGPKLRTKKSSPARAKTVTGVFLVHRIGDMIYYEIPPAELNKDFLWVTHIAKNTLNAGYGGEVASYHVIRWERHEQRILLRSVSYDVVADPKLPIARAVAASNNSVIVMAFNIETTGKEWRAGNRCHPPVRLRSARIQRAQDFARKDSTPPAVSSRASRRFPPISRRK